MNKKRFKQHLSFSRRELFLLIAVVLVSALLITFRSWGGNQVDVAQGIENLLLAIIFVTIALFANTAAQKYYGARKGITTTYTLFPETHIGSERRSAHATFEKGYTFFPYGLIIGLLLGVASNGWIYLLAPGWMQFDTVPKQRIGKWRQRPYFREYGFAVQWGIFANLLLAGIASLFPFPFIALFVKINLLIALFSLIPLPTYSGFHLFFASIYQYVWTASFVIAFSILLLIGNFAWALAFGLLGGTVGFFAIFKRFGSEL